MPIDGRTDVERIEGVVPDDRNSDNPAPPRDGASRSTLETGQAIDATGVIASLDTVSKQNLDLALDGTASATFALDASPDGSTWFEFAEFTTDTIREFYGIGFRYVRLRVKTASTTGGATATVALGCS